MSNFRHVYVILFSLYWAQGLPVGFMTHALPVILRAEGVSLAHIGGFGLLMLPWSIKVFWAPLIDRYGQSEKGHYRSWIIPIQLLTVSVLILLSFLPIKSLNEPIYLMTLFLVLFSLNMLGATQDIATDGLAVSILNGKQQQWGNTFQVIGSRLGFIVGGGAILWALDWLNWQITFLILAALVALNTLPILGFKEAIHRQKQIENFKPIIYREVLKNYFQYFFSNRILWQWFWVLITFKIADGLSGPLLKPLMVDLGLSFSQIGLYITVLGAIAALLGAGLAGILLKFLSRAKALIIFSLFKIFSLLAYAWLAYQYEQDRMVSPWIIYLINAAEDLVSSMLLVVMLTLVMQYSRKNFAGTDFTFQVAIMATVSGGLYAVSGVIGEFLGYANYLLMISVIALVMIIPMIKWVFVAGKVKINEL